MAGMGKSGTQLNTSKAFTSAACLMRAVCVAPVRHCFGSAKQLLQAVLLLLAAVADRLGNFYGAVRLCLALPQLWISAIALFKQQ